ncbi:hypothetical protein SAMN04489761_4541 [Tenacibaculum sp. MAR_2009_124]|uniref:hypothetical protein n=1 Tax=Tenacibaculum sp. MAR_2009_124 TaxID=1250059 RepID=UPI000896D571|nr:hypothetical protein [Tenacibaculum sp. MAR_2009_124]SED18325.1 hypothetical protein SAMN04489761_4541 [Tenacibaculum sp. MAR_2009_124]
MDKDLKSTIEEIKFYLKNSLIKIKKEWRRILSSIISLVFYISILFSNELFGIDFREYLNKIPSKYFTILLSIILISSIFQPLLKKQEVHNNSILKLSSQNDYSRLNGMIGISTISILAALAYAYFIPTSNTNPFLLVLIILTLAIHNRKAKTTAFFIKEGSFLFYENEKEKRRFVLSDVELIVIFKNQITLDYRDKEHLIAFLELKEKDLNDIISWLKKQLPHAEVVKNKNNCKNKIKK